MNHESNQMDIKLELNIRRQPDDATCGPTCLHAVYRYYDDDITLKQVMEDVTELESGGTLAVMLGLHALKRGYKAKLFTYNLQLFDPTWFADGVNLRRKMSAQARVKSNPKLHTATRANLEFLERGGEMRLEDMEPSLLYRYLNRSIPILTGLSATYLYRTARERGWDDEYDDVRGETSGHFVVLCGYDRQKREILIADPLQGLRNNRERKYPVSVYRLICAIMLGVLTYDGNLLIIEPHK